MSRRFSSVMALLILCAFVSTVGDAVAAGRVMRKSQTKSEAPAAEKHYNKVTLECGVKDIVNSLGMRLIKIPAGRFVMGSPAAEAGREDSETQHEVEITQPFYMATTEVTQAQWKSLMKSEPSDVRACGADCPVERVSWFDAIEFCNALSRAENLTACYLRRGMRVRNMAGCSGYRLPTEAEWEYAARAGTSTATYGDPVTFKGISNAPELEPIAWYSGNCDAAYDGAADCSGWLERPQPGRRCGPQPVAGRQPNVWGLYDMLGNVGEWVQDWYGPYDARAAVDPQGPLRGEMRVWRGGSWVSLARFSRAAARLYYKPTEAMNEVGFRVVKSAQE